jgi:hypothetical protein
VFAYCPDVAMWMTFGRVDQVIVVVFADGQASQDNQGADPTCAAPVIIGPVRNSGQLLLRSVLGVMPRSRTLAVDL